MDAHRLLPFLLAAAACGGASGAKAGGAAADRSGLPVPVADGARGPLLWEVQADRGPSYLFGTIHVGYDPHRELPPLVWDALEACDAVVMEADVRDMDPREVARLSLLPDGASLRARLGDESWERLLALLEGAVPPSSVDTVRPWVAYSMVLQALHPTPLPVDRALMDKAAEKGKELIFLEDWRFQLETLDEVTDVADLRQLVAPESRARSRLADMIASYRAGDFQAVASLAHDPREIADDPVEHEKIFEVRNRAWIPRLVEVLNGRRTFVAVGVGHFPGESGLLELLRDEGLLVQRVGPPSK